MAIFNYISFVMLVGGIVAALMLPERMDSRKKGIVVAIGLALALATSTLGNEQSDFASAADVEQKLQNGTPVLVEFYSNF